MRRPVTLAARYAAEELAELERRGLLRHLEPVTTGQGPLVEIAGKRLVNFSSNDYLSLSGHPALAEAARSAISRYGIGAGASRLVVGHSQAHHQLEAKLARFEDSEAALLFNSGYAANLGILSTLAGEGDVIFSDALNHASMIDGCRLSRARTQIYRHCDLGHLEELLTAAKGARRRLIVTDTVFSMDGDHAPLQGIVALARAHEAMVVVDEAHATGIHGRRGAGLCEALGLESEIDLRMGTLSKGLGSFGAWVACDRAVAGLLLNRARSLIFTTALPPLLAEVGITALDVVEREPARRERLWVLISRFAHGMKKLGHPAEARSAIFPLVLGEPEKAMATAARLRERGFLVKAIRPPTVPEGTSRLRIALCAGHSDAQLDGLLEAVATL